MSETTSIQDAIVQMQKTQETCEEALTNLNNHNSDESAHPYILNMLRKVINSDAVYTNEQITELVNQILDRHKKEDFRTAHPGWTEFETSLTKQFTEIQQNYATLKDRVDQIYNSEGQSDLAQQIQAVNDKYAPILANLQEAYQQAVENDQTALAESYKQSIDDTLKQQNAEIMQVIENWQQAQQPEEPTVQIYITFQANGGAGAMANQYLNQGDTFTYPECSFIAPEGYEFERWSSNSTGDGTYGGLVGESLDTSEIANSLTLYAIWKLIPITEETLNTGVTLQSAGKAKVTMQLVKSMR